MTSDEAGGVTSGCPPDVDAAPLLPLLCIGAKQLTPLKHFLPSGQSTLTLAAFHIKVPLFIAEVGLEALMNDVE